MTCINDKYTVMLGKNKKRKEKRKKKKKENGLIEERKDRKGAPFAPPQSTRTPL